MKMHSPPHPGEVFRQVCLEPLNLTVTDAESWLNQQVQFDLWHVEKLSAA